jgi:DNA-binding XRE family transcriptional regulator/phage-related protein
MIKYAIVFLEWAEEFLGSLDEKTRKKVLYNIWKSREVNDPELFKKLDGDIWEFRTKFLTKQIRLLAFWDKTEKTETLVVATHGFIKKTQKTPIMKFKQQKRLETSILTKKEGIKMKKYTLEEITDKYIGEKGTDNREQFEFELKLDVLGEMIKKARKEQHLTQAQLGEIVGVQKAQISKIENNTKDVRLSTIMKVFNALKAKVKMTIDFDTNTHLEIA